MGMAFIFYVFICKMCTYLFYLVIIRKKMFLIQLEMKKGSWIKLKYFLQISNIILHMKHNSDDGVWMCLEIANS